MAKLYDDFQESTVMSFAKSFARLNGQPLDKSEVWYDFESAQAYARSRAAYVGQKIAVIDVAAGRVTHYSVMNTAGDLEDLGFSHIGDEMTIEIKDKVVSLKNWGKQYYKFVPAEIDTAGNIVTPSSYVLTEGFKDGLEIRVHKITETNPTDGTITVTYELAYYEPNSITYDGLMSAHKALETRVEEVHAEAQKAQETADSKVASARGEGAITAAVENHEVVVKIGLDNSGNVQFSQTESGLRATVSEYAITKLESANEGMAASYQLVKDGAVMGATIDIPKDMVVQSGEVVENPEGYPEGTYVVLTLANATNDKLYINVASLIEYVTSGSVEGDMVFVTVDPLTHKVTAQLTDGTVTKVKLHADVQSSLDKADTAVQYVTVLGFKLENGAELTADQIKQALGLGSAAYQDLSNVEATMDKKIEDALSWSDL